MNKNKKVDKNEKYKIVLKRIVNIFCYVCTGITLLFLIIYGCFSCSKSDDQAKVNINIYRNDITMRNYLNNFSNTDLSYFNGSFGYDIKSPLNINQINGDTSLAATDLFISLGSTQSAIVRESNDSVHMLDENWYLTANMHSPLVSGDYFKIDTPNWSRTYTVITVGSGSSAYLSWSVSVYSPENYLYDELYLPVTQGYEASNYTFFKAFMYQFFPKVEFADYVLNTNWYPLEFVSNYADVYLKQSDVNSQNVTFVNNNIYGNSFKILDNTLFSVNGYLYTDLLVRAQRLVDADMYFYNDSYDSNNHLRSNNVGYLCDRVYAYNSITDRFADIWNCPYENEDNTNRYDVYVFESGFLNNKTNRIRLFNRHLENSTVKGYSNGSILDIDGYIQYDSSTGDDSFLNGIAGVFTLLDSSFAGIGSLLNIGIGNGITLLAFVLVPFTVYIIMAIIGLFKR